MPGLNAAFVDVGFEKDAFCTTARSKFLAKQVPAIALSKKQIPNPNSNLTEIDKDGKISRF